MRTDDLARLYEHDGPFASIYLATEGDVEDAARRVQVRWKDARRQLAEAGVPEAALDAVEPLTADAHTRGAALAVIAVGDGVLLAEHLPEPPPRELLHRWGPLPDLLPLLAARQASIPYVAVLTDRTGAEVVAGGPGAGEPIQVEGDTGPHLQRSHPGGWSQLRYQHRAENLWEANASQVAETLTRVVDQLRPRFVAVAGDVRALQLLRDNAPERTRELLVEVGGEFESVERLLAETDKLLRQTVAEDTEALLARFRAERGQGDRAADGVEATLEALRKAQVEVLLLHDDPDDDRTAWFGPAPTLLAADQRTLAGPGVERPVQARLADVLVRAALGTGAEPRLLDAGGTDGPRQGVGALLRWADQDQA
jgi:hypothetical protein